MVNNLAFYNANFLSRTYIFGFNPFDLPSISRRLAGFAHFLALKMQYSSISIEAYRLSLCRGRRASSRRTFHHRLKPSRGTFEFFKTTIALPSKKPLTYYVGPALTPDFDTLLTSRRLLELGKLFDMTTPYRHAGEEASGTAFHYEDGAVQSCNLTVAGFEL